MRRLAALLVAMVASLCAACGDAVVSIGRPGTGDGEFRDPRGIAVSERGIAVLDRTGRLQVFDLAGHWRRTIVVVPGDVRRGLPTGVTWLPEGGFAVADTHQSRIVFRDEEGAVLRVFGEYGVEPGQFLYPQRIARRADGTFLVAEYGFDRANRVQHLRPDGSVIRVLANGPDEELHLGRPMAAVPLADGRTLVADRRAGLVTYDAEGRQEGRFGPRLPPEAAPCGLCVGDDGDVYVADVARSVLLRYAADGTYRGAYGGPGDAPERFREPWDVAWHAGRVYVADMGNHRVARLDPEAVTWGR
jgi:hypothetical protein